MSTLSRQLQKLESDFGVRVFKRTGNRYLVTPAGRKWVATASEMRRSLTQLQPDTAQEKKTVLVTSLENFINHFLLPRISHFKSSVEWLGAERSLDLSRREADVAIRFGRPTTRDYLVQKLFVSGYAIYRSRERRTKREEWAVLNDDFESIEDAKWVRKHVDPPHIRYKVSSSEQVLQLVRYAGVLGLLPCYMGDGDPLLERHHPKIVFDRAAWLVTHRSALAERHIQAFCDELRTVIKEETKLLSGR